MLFPIGDLRKKELIGDVEKICAESTAIAKHVGINLPLDPWKEIVTILEKTASNKCSMLQDVENQQETEIEAMVGLEIESLLLV